MEEWKDIEGYEGLYQVSTFGRIRSFYKRGGINQRILTPLKHKSGYLDIGLSKNGTYSYKYIHRLVAQTFIPNPDNKPCVNHIDEDKMNNCVENLEWCTYEYNNNFGTRNQRATESRKKKVMCIETEKVFDSIKAASEFSGIPSTYICKVLKGKFKTSGGYHWRYV